MPGESSSQGSCLLPKRMSECPCPPLSLGPAPWSSSAWLSPTLQSGPPSGVMSRVDGARGLCHSRGSQGSWGPLVACPCPYTGGHMAFAQTQMGTEKEGHCGDTLLHLQIPAKPPFPWSWRSQGSPFLHLKRTSGRQAQHPLATQPGARPEEWWRSEWQLLLSRL